MMMMMWPERGPAQTLGPHAAIKTMNHFYTAIDLRQSLPGNLAEVLFNKSVQLTIHLCSGS